MPSTAENALFSARAYDMIPKDQFRKRLSDRWRLFPVDSRLRESPVTGFRARVYHNEAMRELVIAFAGTQLNDWGDWGAIWAMTNRHEPPQFNDASALYREVQRQLEQKGIKTDISFTGHSLGGALAQYMAIAARGCRAETFGAPGILKALGSLAGYYDALYPYPVINHVAGLDEIGDAMGPHLGKTVTHRIDFTDWLPLPLVDRLLHNHSMSRYLWYFQRNDGAFVRRKITPSGHVTLEECNWTGRVRRKIKRPPGF
jgi:Lipase (class 3)